MFNPLLERQIKKHLAQLNEPVPEAFLAAVNDAYKNYEDQIIMLQRATKLSSDELFEANTKLREETQLLKEVNNNLEQILNSLNTGAVPLHDKTTIAEHIKKQALEIVEITRQREQLLNNLEQQNQELNEYTHMVSHDLKAPLRNISTLVSWIIQDNQDDINPTTKDLFNLIQSNLKKMDLLIHGMVNYSSINKQEAEDRLVNINELIEDILRKITVPDTIKIHVHKAMPQLFGNSVRFMHLFQNLIENAIKFNDKENGFIEVGFIETQDLIEFFVKDNGKGIPEAYHNKIFNIFTKLDNNSQASGIGLSIVKKIINYYGGRIWLKSKEQEGATFFFSIPKTWNNPTWII